MEAQRNNILDECDEDNDGDDDEPMDGMPMIRSIYDTIKKPVKKMNINIGVVTSTKSHSSIEDMFIHSDENMSDDPDDTNGDGTTQTGSTNRDRNIPSIGPSIPSLATSITNNRLSTITNKTALTNATKRLYLKSNNNTKSMSDDHDIHHLSSGDESTCITAPNTVSTLSPAINNEQKVVIQSKYKNNNNKNSLFHIKHKHSADTMSDIEITINDEEDEDDDDDDVVTEMEEEKKHSNNTSVMSRIKQIKRVLSIGHHTNSKYLNSNSDDQTQSGSDIDTVSYHNSSSVHSYDNTLNTITPQNSSEMNMNKYYDKKGIPRFISENDKKTNKIKNSISYFDDHENEDDDDDDDDDGSYEWIKSALKCCDENGWEQYFANFKQHKVSENRLDKLDDIDWRELIPAIGPRNDFKELWSIKQITADINNI